MAVTQGSQSLTLGLTLTAAPQLVERSRLMRCPQRHYFSLFGEQLACDVQVFSRAFGHAQARRQELRGLTGPE
jgi:hypothetical protein